MSQTVHLDMEVLQRIKFLMEYDVMKTSSENFLVEQASMVKPKQNLAQPKTQPSQSLVGNKKTDWSKLPSMRADPLSPKSAKWGDVPNVTLDTVTQDVRKFMSDWRVAAVETIMTYTGVGIPVVLGANGLWMTLEIIQASKGNPDWWSLSLSILATVTAGSQAAWLKPLYKLGGKTAGGLVGALDLLYQKAKSFGGGSATGVLDDLMLLLRDLTPKLPKLMDILEAGIEWISKFKWGQKVESGIIKSIVALKSAKDWLSGIIKSIGNWVRKYMDAPLYKMAKKQGVDSPVARNLGGATRWGTGVGTGGYLLKPDEKNTTIQGPGLQYAPGTFVPKNPNQP